MIAVMQSDLFRRHRLTVEDYLRMAEAGLLAPEARVELIEGEIIDMAPTGHRHASVIWRLIRRFARDLQGRVCVWNQSTFRLDEISATEPDLVILKQREDEYGLSPPSPDDALLIVEVSDSSIRYDRKVKLPLYAQHNIPEVWLVEIEHPRVHFFHTLEGGQYTHRSSTAAPGRLSLQALPEETVDLTGLLDSLREA